MALQDLRAVLLVEPGMADDGGRHAVRLGHALHPGGLLDLARPVALRLDMDGRDDIVAGGVAAVVLRQVVPPERRKVAEEELVRRRVGEPGIAKRLQIPEVVVGIDNRQVGIVGGHRGLPAAGGAHPAPAGRGAEGGRRP